MEILATTAMCSIIVGCMIAAISIYIKPKWRGWKKIIWFFVYLSFTIIAAGWIFKSCGIYT